MGDTEQQPQWTQDEEIAFECARSAINHSLAIYLHQIRTEEGKPNPDNDVLANLEALRTKLHQERAALHFKNHAEIARVRAEYGAMARAWNQGQESDAAKR